MIPYCLAVINEFSCLVGTHSTKFSTVDFEVGFELDTYWTTKINRIIVDD